MDHFLRVVCLALCFAAPAFAQLGGTEGGGTAPPPASVIVPRGDHLTIKFWPNRSWYGNSIEGRIQPFTAAAAPEASMLRDVSMRLVRFEPIGSRDEALPGLTLQELQSGLGKDFREVGERATRTDEDGDFRFDDLAAGTYSIQIDWESIPEELKFVTYTIEYPERTSEFRSLLVPMTLPEVSVPSDGRQ